jgi:phytoene dehydrogenase-like protein
MTLAWEIARRDIPVILLEASDRLGGKAGSNRIDDQLFDHGYHVFPGWYRNTRRILWELELTSHLIDIHCVHYVKPGEFPRKHTLWELSSALNLWRNLRSGLVPWYEAILASYYALDLSSAHFSHRSYLDRVSANGYLRSRIYATEGVAAAHESFVLQAASIPNYEISAMTAKRVTESWFRTPSPIFSILDGSLQERFIEPFQGALEKAGVEIYLGHGVRRILAQNGRVTGVVLENGKLFEDVGQNDLFAVATPHEVTFGFVDPALYAIEDSLSGAHISRKRLSDLAHLRSAPMAALHVGLRRRVDEIPAEHTVLVGSHYELSFIDVSQHWKGLPHTLLSVIASNFSPLEDLPQSDMQDKLLGELLAYLGPVVRSEDVDLKTVHIFPNLNVPLFLNTVGAWTYRPGTKTRLENLYIAGDYCRTQADLTTMESAISSGVATAGHVLRDLGRRDVVAPLPLKAWPQPLMRAAAYSFLPAILALRLGVALWEGHGSALPPPQ